MRAIIGEIKPNDRYDVRSRDCHATDAHMSYGKLSNGTSCDALKIKPCTVIIHAGYTAEIKDSR